MKNTTRYLALCVAVLGVLLGFALPGWAQTLTPFEKDGALYVVQQPTGGSAVLNKLNRSVTPYTLTPLAVTGTAPPTALNGLGYNRVDGYMYILVAPTSGTAGLYRIGKTGPNSVGYLSLGAVSGLPANTYFAGDVSTDGYLYVSASAGGATNTLYRINLNGNPASYSATAITTTVTSTDATAATTISVGDFAFATNGKLYAVSLNGSLLYEITVSSGTTTATAKQTTTVKTGVSASAVIGTMFFDGANGFYAYDNAGGFYAVDIPSASVSSISTATPVSRSDGTSVTDTPEYLDIVKNVGTLNQINARTFDVPYTIGVKNTGTVTATNVQVNDKLNLTFSSGSPAISIVGNPRLTATEQTGVAATLNQSYDGVNDTRLFAGTDDYPQGAIVRVAFTVRLTYPTLADVPEAAQLNTAYASSVAGTTFINDGYTYPNNIAVPPINAATGEASSPGTVFPTRNGGDTPAGTGVNLPPIALQGRVYEDTNFGGGLGRAFNATQGMKGVENARIEIYDSAGNFVAFTTTLADGTWSYAVYTSATYPINYYARVVNSSVLSTRAGSTAALVGVQTFRTNNGAAVTGEIGGRAPAKVDAGAAATGTTLNTSTFALSGTATGQAQTVSQIVVADTSDRNGLDFGFNFDTIVNTNDTGQGSMRQFVLNSNALSNTDLAQVGQTPNVETSIFQIPASALTGATGNRVALITLASGLSITGANAGATAIDGRTQTANVGDTNTGEFGTGGNVGVGPANVGTLTLLKVPKPEIEINGPNSIAIGLDIQAASAIVRNVSMWGFGNAGDSPTIATIRVGQGASSNFTGAAITQVVLGASATGTTPTAPALYGKGDLIGIYGPDDGFVTNSFLGFCGGKGIDLKNGADSWTIQGNEIRNVGRDANIFDGIDAQGRDTKIIGNLISDVGGVGIDTSIAMSGNIVSSNTVRNCGLLCTPTTGESAGLRIFGTNSTVRYNISNDNYGAGIQIQAAATVLISQNSIYNNGNRASNSSTTKSGQIGIDLLKSGDDVTHGNAPFVTPNDSGDGDSGGNGLLNFPVFTNQKITGGNLVLEGFAPAQSVIEVFRAAPDPSGFGEGQTFAFTFTEGSAADTDATAGNYDAAFLQSVGYPADVAAHIGSETGANRFRVTVAANGLTATSTLTATATVANQTSEFSAVTVTFVSPLTNPVSGTLYLDANRNGTLDANEGGANISSLFVKAFLDGASSAAQVVAVDAATGSFTFTNLTAGTYTLILDDNNAPTDKTPATSANSSQLTGYVGTQSPDGTRQITVGNQPILSQDFGLFNGAQISGNVYEDTGAGTGPGIAGVKVNLIRVDTGAVIDTATTDGSGNFVFRLPNSLASGKLRVVEINPSGYQSAKGDAGTTTANGGAYTLATDTIEFNYVAGSAYTGLKFGDSRRVTFINEDSKTGPVGSSVVYSHVFTAQTAGSVSFATTQLPSPTNPNWSVVAYQDSDKNGVLDGADAIITAPIPVVAGVPITVFLKNFIPTTAANGAQDRLTITATFTPTGNNNGPVQTNSRSDLTTVAANSGLLLTKAVNAATARSNDVLVYTITYRNAGAEALTNLVINDATPAYTTFLSAANGTLAPGLTAPTIVVPTGPKGAVSWTFGGSLNPGQSGTVTFSVRVQ